MKTLTDLYKENPKEYMRLSVLANKENKRICVVDDKLELCELKPITDYALLREMKYPSIGDQLDMLWHAIDNNALDKTSDFYLRLKTVKDEYPKG